MGTGRYRFVYIVYASYVGIVVWNVFCYYVVSANIYIFCDLGEIFECVLREVSKNVLRDRKFGNKISD